MTITVKQLAQELTSIAEKHPDWLVYASRDPEGNGFNALPSEELFSFGTTPAENDAEVLVLWATYPERVDLDLVEVD